MAGALQRITRLPLVPLIAGDAQQFPVHLDDLVHAVAVLAEAEPMPRGPIGVANATPVPFRDLLTVLAALEGRRCRFIAVPWRTVYWALRACERAHLRPPFRADSLLGLVHPAPMVPGADQLEGLGISLRPFPSPVHE